MEYYKFYLILALLFSIIAKIDDLKDKGRAASLNFLVAVIFTVLTVGFYIKENYYKPTQQSITTLYVEVDGTYHAAICVNNKCEFTYEPRKLQ